MQLENSQLGHPHQLHVVLWNQLRRTIISIQPIVPTESSSGVAEILRVCPISEVKSIQSHTDISNECIHLNIVALDAIRAALQSGNSMSLKTSCILTFSLMLLLLFFAHHSTILMDEQDVHMNKKQDKRDELTFELSKLRGEMISRVAQHKLAATQRRMRTLAPAHQRKEREQRNRPTTKWQSFLSFLKAGVHRFAIESEAAKFQQDSYQSLNATIDHLALTPVEQQALYSLVENLPHYTQLSNSPAERNFHTPQKFQTAAESLSSGNLQEFRNQIAELDDTFATILHNIKRRYRKEFDQVNQHQSHLKLMTSLLILFSIFIMCCAALALQNRILNPLKQMVEAAQNFSQGDYLYQLDHLSNDEIGELAAAMISMGEELFLDQLRREHLQEGLRRSEERFELMMEATSDGVWDWDLHSGLVYRSPSFYRMLGYHPRKFKPRMESFFSLVHPEDLEKVQETIASLIQLEEDFLTTTFRVLDAEGNTRWILSRGKIVQRDEHDQPLRLVGTHVDITKQKQAEDAIRKSEKKYRRLVEGLKREYFFFTMNTEKLLTYVSPSIHTILGYTKVEAEQAYQSKMTSHALNEAAEEHIHSALQGENPPPFRMEMYDAEEEKRIVDCIVFPKFDFQGKPSGVEGIAKDITKQIQAEQELIQAREAADEANQAKSDFLSNMSHELRTPLNGVLGYVQILLRDRNLDHTQRESLEAIENCGQHLLTLINDVLDLSKIESGHLEIHYAPCNLQQLLRATCHIVQQRAESKGIGFYFRLEPSVPETIMSDATKLRQVLVNLLSNGVKFTDQGSVSLEVSTCGSQLILEVIDTGIGIAPEQQELIFNPFKQSEAGRKVGGTGLGLAISQRLVNAMDGELSLQSEAGVGSTFCIQLPLKELTLSNEDLEETFEHIPFLESELTFHQHAHPSLAKKSIPILLVDSHQPTHTILMQLLKETPCELHSVTSLVEAQKYCRETSFQLIIFDQDLLSSEKLSIQDVRKIPNYSHVPFLVLSDHWEPQHVDRVALESVQGMLRRPIDTDEFYSALDQHLRLDVWQVEQKPNDSQTDHAPEISDASEEHWLRGISPEDAAELGTRLHNALQIRNVTEIQFLIKELNSAEVCNPVLVSQLESLLDEFDFQGLQKLAEKLLNTDHPLTKRNE